MRLYAGTTQEFMHAAVHNTNASDLPEFAWKFDCDPVFSLKKLLHFEGTV